MTATATTDEPATTLRLRITLDVTNGRNAPAEAAHILRGLAD